MDAAKKRYSKQPEYTTFDKMSLLHYVNVTETVTEVLTTTVFVPVYYNGSLPTQTYVIIDPSSMMSELSELPIETNLTPTSVLDFLTRYVEGVFQIGHSPATTSEVAAPSLAAPFYSEDEGEIREEEQEIGKAEQNEKPEKELEGVDLHSEAGESESDSAVESAPKETSALAEERTGIATQHRVQEQETQSNERNSLSEHFESSSVESESLFHAPTELLAPLSEQNSSSSSLLHAATTAQLNQTESVITSSSQPL